ncbi:hypothetical protein Q5W_15435 [Hydrogenophaga sp. PBC]|uniref:hypothetical protein n=1 Tax=Hydrogenophaga sp. PBC TaxID=795665 RepID=UPI0002606A50|nr:hypothetical protein [Hydrogenophaga sp. PBC]AOS80262.1 hypothetical protein Q5W_15435 [Hydrogenophaga sp. PBC]
MASIVDICNTALAHLGNDNEISSIDPPDGSVEAGRCKRFYPIARKELIERFVWPFACKRQTLASVANPSEIWTYAYQLPPDCIRPVRVLTAQVANALLFELSQGHIVFGDMFDDSKSAPYEVEDGVLFTHEPEAVLLYLRDVVDTTRYTPTFVSALGFLLASYLAGPLIRGADGARAAQNYRQLALAQGDTAMTMAARGSHERHFPVASHLAVR